MRGRKGGSWIIVLDDIIEQNSFIKGSSIQKQVDLYTDGACSGNPGPGGWAAVLLYRGHEREMSGYSRDTTNNRMELTAVIEGLRALKQSCEVTVYTDSKYIVEAVEKGWVYGWEKRNWKRAGNKPALNSDLWKELLSLLSKHTVHFSWVKGHDGNPFNERCDALAVKMSKQQNLF
ncbi:MAG: ribonuclease HI [Oscillospiraceae bacterium]|nr:ribonuclease HI [Oscillospiraceae bacterium]